jgi:hypothetical protein
MYEKERANWLFAFFVFHVLLYVVGNLDRFFGYLIDGFPRGGLSFEGNISWKIVICFLIAPMYHLLIGGTTYYFAYLKKGTRWLLFLMLSLLAVALLTAKTFINYGRHDWSFVGCPIGIMVYQIFFVYLAFYYLFHCYNLYIANGGMSIQERFNKMVSFGQGLWK